MRNIVFILTFLFALLSMTLADEPKNNETPKFELFVEHKDFNLNINVDSVKLIKGPGYPLISIDAQLVLSKPIKHPTYKKSIKSYISNVAADCKNDQLYMLKNEAYTEDGSFLATDPEKAVLRNPKLSSSPVTNLLILLCSVSDKMNQTSNTMISI